MQNIAINTLENVATTLEMDGVLAEYEVEGGL